LGTGGITGLHLRLYNGWGQERGEKDISNRHGCYILVRGRNASPHSVLLWSGGGEKVGPLKGKAGFTGGRKRGRLRRPYLTSRGESKRGREKEETTGFTDTRFFDTMHRRSQETQEKGYKGFRKKRGKRRRGAPFWRELDGNQTARTIFHRSKGAKGAATRRRSKRGRIKDRGAKKGHGK